MNYRLIGALAISLCAFSCSESNLDERMAQAEAFVGLGDESAALEIYKDVAKECPQYKRCAEALMLIGDIEANTNNDPAKALEAYGRVVELFPITEAARSAHVRRAALFERQSDYLGAAEEYADLLQRFPKSDMVPRYLLKLGESYLAMGNVTQARIELEGLLRAQGYDESIRQEAMFDYAETYFLEGRLGLAEKGYRRLIEDYPDSPLVPEARMKVATCQEERGFLGDATRTLAGARKEYPNKAAIDVRLKAMRSRGKGKPPKEIVEIKKQPDPEPEEKK